MTLDRPDWFYHKLGTKLEDYRKSVPTLEQTVEKRIKELNTSYSLSSLALGRDGELWITEEERENHFWVLGSTGEGKSKFLEQLIENDIDRLLEEQDLPDAERRASSLCFIDSTPQGLNARRVLNYCASIGFKKVILVDPRQIVVHGKVLPINPFNYHKSYVTDSVDYLKDAFRVLFEVEDESKTAYITSYLAAVFTLLHHAGLTLRELIYFTLPFDPAPGNVPDWAELSEEYQDKRNEIYAKVRAKIEHPAFPQWHRPMVKKHLAEVQLAFKNQHNFIREFGSTARRINALVNSPNLSLIFGHRQGVKFEKLVSDGWVLLVNASTGLGMGTLPSRLLATVIINQIIFTIERIRERGFNRPFYLYLDEAQQYATDELVKVLNTKRNIKLRMILAHHYPSQFPPKILKSIQNNAKTKIAFYVGGERERGEVANEMYGGDLDMKQVEYALSQQGKRQAVFKLDKAGSVIAKTHDTPDAPDNPQFLLDLLNTADYLTPEEILKDCDDRFIKPLQKDTKGPQYRKTSDRKADSQASVPRGVRKRRGKNISEGDEEPAKAPTGRPISI